MQSFDRFALTDMILISCKHILNGQESWGIRGSGGGSQLGWC